MVTITTQTEVTADSLATLPFAGATPILSNFADIFQNVNGGTDSQIFSYSWGMNPVLYEHSFQGTGFQYNSGGDLISGTVNSYTFEYTYVNQHSVSKNFVVTIELGGMSVADLVAMGDFSNLLSGNDVIIMNDPLFGKAGDMIIETGAGNDTVRDELDNYDDNGIINVDLGVGDDTLFLGFGSREFEITLGEGADKIVQYTQDNPGQAAGLRTILDFNPDEDTIKIAGSIAAQGLDVATYYLAAVEGGTMLRTNAGGDFDVIFIQGVNINQLQLVNGVVSGNPNPVGPILGTENNDVLSGTAGDDIINGLGGNDRLISSAGSDTLDGGSGIDTADYSGEASGVGVALDANVTWGAASGDSLISIEKLIGTIYGDTLIGNSGFNVLVGGGGNDVLDGRQGNDILWGGWGNDTLKGGWGNGADELHGGGGNDTLIGGAGADMLDGGDGIDTADYSGESSGVGVALDTNVTWGAASGDSLISIEKLIGTIYGDTLIGNSGFNVLVGGGGNDVLDGRQGNDILWGGWGNDTLKGGWGNGADELHGGGGNDTLIGGGGNDILDGGYGADMLFGGQGNDSLNGWNGDDVMFGDAGNDTLLGWYGSDTLFGGAGHDIVDGGAGNDYIHGDDGNDTLIGRGGDDVLFGGNGDDYFIAGVGDDGIFMGAGNDIMLFTKTFEAGGVQYGNGHNTIFDFVSGEDKIEFEAGGMTMQDVLDSIHDTEAGVLIEYEWQVDGVTYSQSLLLDGLEISALDYSTDFIFG